MAPFIIILIILAIGAVAFYSWQEEKRRKEVLRNVREKGWVLGTIKITSMHKDFPGLQIFQKGHSRSAKNFIRGEFHGRQVTLLDYRYVVGHGKNRTTHNRGMVILKCDFPTIPMFIRRENPMDRVGEFFGSDDIDFESSEFSRKFYVKSNDRKWAYDVIHTRTMEYLMRSPSFTIEFGLGEIAIYKSGWCEPDRYEKALKLAWDLYELIPDFVIRQMKGDGR